MTNKKIVLCSDGTGNYDVKARGTNVFKLYEAIDRHGHKLNPKLSPQIAFYHDGVGTSKFIPFRLLGGALGLGFSRIVKDLYMELAYAYEPGDKLYLFGFSRGAYTVRTLAGLIQCCGIMNVRNFDQRQVEHAVEKCWQAFREVAFTRNERDEARRSHIPERANKTTIAKRRAELGTIIEDKLVPGDKVNIAFLGVWDTVNAIGAPTNSLRTVINMVYPLTFAELTVGPGVKRACQAISIDDERLTFSPELWNEKSGEDARIHQVWFAGVHSNVGGGYPKQGMSLVTLDWMMAEAEDCGLRFIEADREYIRRHQDVNDKLYDSRASFAVYYRWNPRDIVELCQKHKMSKPKIHLSVFARIANGTDGYAPGNIPYECEIVTTKSTNPWPPSQTIKEMMRQVMERHKPGHPSSSLAEMKNVVRSGKTSYLAFLTLTVLTLCLSYIPFIVESVQWRLRFWLLLTVGFLVIGVLIRRRSSWVDGQLNTKYSSRWNKHRDVFRKLLGTDKPAEKTGTI